MCTEIGAENSLVQRSAISMEKSATSIFTHVDGFFFFGFGGGWKRKKKKGKRDKADSGFRERFDRFFFSDGFSVFREEEGKFYFRSRPLSTGSTPSPSPLISVGERSGDFSNTRDKSKQSRFSYVTDRKPEIAARYRGFGPLPKRIFLFVSRHSCARRE